MMNLIKLCPKCESAEIKEIIYGLPTLEQITRETRGEIILGGCCILDSFPNLHCRKCNYEWDGNASKYVSRMNAIKVYIGGYSGPSYTIGADLQQGFLYYAFDPLGKLVPDYQEQVQIELKAWYDLLTGLYFCRFDQWEKEYVNPHILDGTQWEIEIRLNTKSTIRKTGSNQYPQEWELFSKLIADFADKPFG